MEKINVAVLYGGHSPEHEVSKASAATIFANMSEEKYCIIPVYITLDGQWLLHDGGIENMNTAQLEKFGANAVLSPDRTHKCLLRIVAGKVKRVPVDIVFPALHGVNGEDGTVQGLLELAGVPYVGCGVLASAVCMDKCYTKIIAEAFGIRQAGYTVFYEEELSGVNGMESAAAEVRGHIGYPCFVKPANTGSSVGISKVKGEEALAEALTLAAKHDRKIIVEKCVAGRELECAVLGAGAGAEASAVGEIIPAAEFYDYDAKYHNPDSKTVVPASVPEAIREEIRAASVKIFNAVGGSGLARVDFFLEEGTNNVIFNEINTMPGFTAISMYPLLWNEMGVSTPELIDRLIEIGLSREC